MNAAEIIAHTNRSLAEAGPLMSQAAAEITRLRLVVEQYRGKSVAHEYFVNKLFGLMNAEKFDEAADFVRTEYLAIHGPRD